MFMGGGRCPKFLANDRGAGGAGPQEGDASMAGLNGLRKKPVALGASAVSTTPALGAPPLLISGGERFQQLPS